MSRRLVIAGAVILFAGATAWAGWTIAARRAEVRVEDFRREVARITGERVGAERRVAELTAALEEAQERRRAVEELLELELAGHRAVVESIRSRLREAGEALEEVRAERLPAPALSLGLEAPESLELEEAWQGWRACEDALGAALEAQGGCQDALAAQEDLLEAGRRVEEDLRAELEARRELERQLRRAARRRQVSERLRLVGAALAGFGAGRLLD